MIRADRCDVESGESLRGLRCGHAGERLRTLVECQQGDDRKARHAANRLDRVDGFVQVVERLDHEQVGAAALEDLRLLGEGIPADTRDRLLTERTDRACDEHVLARDLAGVAGELDADRVDALQLVLEEVLRELDAVRAERIRLDQLGAGVDEADVQRDHRLRRAQVRLLGGAQSRHGGGEQRPHAAVADDRRACLQAFEEAVTRLGWGGHLLSFRTRSTHPPDSRPTGFGTLPGGRLPKASQGRFPRPSLDAERDGARFRDGV